MPLSADQVSKSFGPTQALIDVNIRLESGKVHALVGENGAGKSTLFKICAGAVRPDRAAMQLDGQPYAPRSLHDAQVRGVALVFQEITINPALGIAENIFIDRMSRYAGVLGISGWKRLRAEAQRILDEIGANISVNQRLETLDLGQLKILEIARALSYRPKVLLLDESTAFLSTFEIDALFRVIHTLRQQNIAIGYISHHLDEIERIADEITILKDGAWVGRYARGELTEEQIKAKMVGREIGQDMYGDGRRRSISTVNVLTLDGIHVRHQIEPITLELYAGEVLGIGGLKGAGGEALLSVINGDVRPSGGRMTIDGRPYHPSNPSQAWAQGIAYLPGDRTGEGLILDFSVLTNLSLANIPQRAGFIDHAKENAMVERLIAMLQIKAANARVTCSSLSGGNLQKVVLGKCVGVEPRVLLLNNPTRGIDVGARTQIYQIIQDLAEQGLAVILLSEDLPELIGMSDRIVVLRKGRLSHVFERGVKPSEQDVIEHMI